MSMLDALKFDRIRRELRGILLTLCMVVIVTAAVYFIVIETGLGHGSVVYLIPVVIAATRWGIVPAIVAAICGVLASAFFFYPPLYSFRIKDPHEVLNLILFIFVAVVVSQLATRLKRQLEVSRQREIDLRDLYAFSRRLAVAFDVSDIHAAIEDHLATVMQRKVVLFAGARDASASSGRRAGVMVPEQVLAEVVQAASGRRVANSGVTVPADSGDVWLVRAVSPKSSEFGVIAINLGRASQDSSDEMRIRVDAVLADATATLERLGVAHAIGEARMRSQTDQLREALIGSVSHELRTPLASILGAATVLREEVQGAAKGLHHHLHLGIQLRDHAVEVVQVVQVQAAQHRVVVPEPALQRHRQVRDLAAHPAQGQVCQHRAAPLPVDQGLDHRPPGLRRDAGRD